ncbi:MAG: hypothetical protein ABI166_01630 [Mucilaginibacter sp.]
MKLLVEKTYAHVDAELYPLKFEKIKDKIAEELSIKILNKIAWQGHAIDNANSSIGGYVHVMSVGEWEAAKKILSDVFAKFPETEDDIKQAFQIIDPLGNF